MKTTAVRLYGKNDLRLETFELPPIGSDEILAKIISDSICMSSYKELLQGAAHPRVRDNVAENPIIIGHEFCGEILQVGSRWKDQFVPGERFTVQPSVRIPGDELAAAGYTFPYMGGDATYIVIPSIYIERNCVLKYEGEAFYFGSLAEPMSCIVGGFHVNYHAGEDSYQPLMGIVENGNMALLAGVGPMGLGAIDYAIHNPRKPKLLVVTDINQERLHRAASILTQEEAAANGVRLEYVNTSDVADVPALLRSFTENAKGFDDVYVYAPVPAVIEQADQILGHDGCLNFFAGPTNPDFTARFNFYNVHYKSTHVAGNTGGTNDDLAEALDLMARGVINPSAMITHIGGLDSAIETTMNLPNIPGGKKLIYTHIKMPLTAISDLRAMEQKNPMFGELADIVEANNNIWSAAAEKYLLEHAQKIGEE